MEFNMRLLDRENGWNGHIPNNCEYFRNYNGTKINFINCESIISIGNGFLTNSLDLTSIDMSNFINVTDIGNYFLFNCGNLGNIEMSKMKKINNIGRDFCSYCYIESFDLEWISAVNSIGDYFLYCCERLSSITTYKYDKTISNMMKTTSTDENITRTIKTVGHNFISSCTNLLWLDITGIRIEKIGVKCLSGCYNLIQLNLNGFLHTELIGDNKMLYRAHYSDLEHSPELVSLFNNFNQKRNEIFDGNINEINIDFNKVDVKRLKKYTRISPPLL